MVMNLPSLPSFSWRGVAVFSAVLSALAILPNSVLSPVAVTSALQLPPVTNVPLYIMLNRSASGVFGSDISSSAFLFTGTLSPVRADSFTAKLLVYRRRASAGILSPVDNSIMSPTTMSCWFMSIILPPLSTFMVTLSPILDSASNAFALLPSMTTLIVTDSAIATNTPTHSIKSAFPPVAAWKMLTPSAMISAAISINSMGSLIASKMRCQTVSGFLPVSLFAPNSSLFFSTCSSLRP